MKTLVIHPQDISTTFLSPIYVPVKNKTVITGGISKDDLRKLVCSHDRIIMLGHGSPDGLLSVGRFEPYSSHIIERSLVQELKSKKHNIYIWCYASEFVEENQLSGFCSGMFISEVGEASCLGLKGITQREIDQSNSEFSRIVACNIELPPHQLLKAVKKSYLNVARVNRVAAYNITRLSSYN